ncbi:MAG: hypothetical protein E7315_01885 [Clostridiales bacterium]|nr:hypothetical protein [Clostridiales bacterium]
MHSKNDDTKYKNNPASKAKSTIRRNVVYAALAFVLLSAGLGAIIAGVSGSNEPIVSPPLNTNDIINNYTPPVNSQEVITPRPTATIPIVSTPTPVIQVTPPVIETPTPTSGPVSSDTEVSFFIELPFDAQSVINDFSDDELVFSETLDEWTTHAGVDFKCSIGEEVRCAADGIVSNIIDDPLYGTTVIVQHKDGFSTLYSGIDPSSVQYDELVARGQILGTVSGEIPIEESIKESHIHFELFKDGQIINPLEYTR